MNKILFKEEQQFREWWQIVLRLIATIPAMIMCFYTLYMQNVVGVQIGDSPAPNVVMILALIGLGLGLWVSFSIKMEVWLDSDGIHYRFFPLISKNKFISKEEIQRFEIRKYSAAFDYGGRGFRRGLGRKWGKAYTISGNLGLQLYLTNGKKVLFGTQRHQAIVYAMDEMMKSKTGNFKY
jgi:hypothetical protein